jgi:ribosomal protein S18 acetylase RimI-like enzyme
VVALVDAEVTHPLRLTVLRPGMGPESVRFPGDDHPLAAHAAASLTVGEHPGPQVVAVGSVYPDPPPWEPERPRAWRIRGMATRPAVRSRGLGRAVLDALMAHAAAHGGEVIWCHARIGALDFYRRAGFVAVGSTFDDGVAMHRSMSRPLGAVDAAGPPPA